MLRKFLCFGMLALVTASAAKDLEAPKFRLFDGKLSVRAGGNVKGTASFDWGSPVDDPNCFFVSDIPMTKTPGDGGKFQISAQQSGLYLDLRWLEGDTNEAQVCINGKFTGHDYNFELEEAFARYRGFKVGYAFGLFSDPEDIIPTVDNEDSNMFVGINNGVVDYEHDFKSGISLGVGAELPIESVMTDRFTRTVNTRIPDFPAYVQYAWGAERDSWVKVSGIVRTLVYRDLLTQKNENVVGWGVKLSGTNMVLPKLRAYYKGIYGQGISSYFRELSDRELDLLPCICRDGRLSAPKAWGAYVGLKYDFTDKFYASAAYTFMRLYPKSHDAGSDALFRNGQSVMASVFYDITSYLTWGMEYKWGQRTDMSGLTNHNNRLQTMLQVSF